MDARPQTLFLLRYAIPCLLLPLILSGCAVIRQNYGAPVPDNDTFVDGQTHYADVLAELGAPSSISRIHNGMAFLYERSSITERQIGIDIDVQDIPLLKFVYGRGKAQGESTVLMFDAQGTLLSHDWESWVRDLGSGTSIQLFLSVMSVTDPGGFDAEPTEYLWGASLLQARLSEALNRQSDLASGQSGLTGKGNPDGAGQYTLEMRPID